MKLCFTLLVAAFMTTAYANQKTICGQSDDRQISHDPKVGRTLPNRTFKYGCTATMISKSCAISAGHCHKYLGVMEFNTPQSRNGNIQHPAPRDVYDVDKASVVYVNAGPGNDWAVFKVKKNAITGRFAGHAQGYYDVSFRRPSVGSHVSITGYGLDQSQPNRNMAQQENDGFITKLDLRKSVIQHRVDTMGGNSGSSIIHVNSGKIVGVHTHGGCNNMSEQSANRGTLIATHAKFKAAIRKCLQSE